MASNPLKLWKLGLLVLCTAATLALIPIGPALAQEGVPPEGVPQKRDKRQPPAQVAIQIVLTAAVLKWVEPWLIPKD